MAPIDLLQPETVTPWGFDIARTPFCSFNKITLNRKNATCYLSNKKLQKGDYVYQFRFFNGAYGIPSSAFYCTINAFDTDEAAILNRRNYKQNQYKLSDYAFKIAYRHPLINRFWNTLDQFNLNDVLQMIAFAEIHPTPFLRKKLAENETASIVGIFPQADMGVYAATGGEFINLLYVLVKCGYLEEILARMPALSADFPLLLMCFNDDYIRRYVSDYLSLPDLSSFYAQALSPYSKKSPKTVQQLMNFGSNHPDFMQLLATSLNRYEYHLYSNSLPGINWFFEPFEAFINASGGGLLDFLISEPALIDVMKEMQQDLIYPIGVSFNTIDTYDNSLPYLYRAVLLGSFSRNGPFDLWQSLPEYLRTSEERTRFRAVHAASLKIIDAWN